MTAQNDCPEAIMVCGDESYWGLNATGIGVQEIGANACGSSENNSLWLKVVIKDGGTLGFVLTPESSDLFVDFDFWLFGPDLQCNALGTAIRCSTTNPLQANLTYNTTGMDDTHTDVSEGPGPNGDAFINWITVQDDETYYLIIDRPIGTSNFSIDWTGTATFHSVPVFLNPDTIPLEISKCDNDGTNDQSVAFDLTVFEDMFIGPQTDVNLTYHSSNNDAITDVNAITAPGAFHNTSNPQTIYMRLENTVTGCFSTEALVLSLALPVAGTPQNLVLCDTAGNGIRQFNLTANDNAIQNGAPDTAVTYHTSQAAAQAGTTPITGLFTNTIPYGPQTIWARLRYTNGCMGADIVSFTVSVAPPPTFMNPQNVLLNLEQCDDDGTDDLSDTFDLTVHEAMFTGAQQGLVFSYYTSAADAQAGTNPIATPSAYTNISNPQTIIVRAQSSITGCFDFLNFTIRIINPVVAGTPPDLVLCDTEGTGIQQFDLSLNSTTISNGAANPLITYYASQEDAENEQNPLALLYSNQVPYLPEIIWARLEYSTGCFGHDVTSFDISVVPLPVFNNPNSSELTLKKCDGDNIDDNSVAFNLKVHEAMFAGFQPNMVFTYHTTEADAISCTNPIAMPQAYANISNPQTVYARMKNTITSCYDYIPFDLEVTNDLVAGEPQDIELCDSFKNGMQEFDLSANTLLLQNGNLATSATYYSSQEDAENETNPLPTLHQNSTPYGTETIWARLENTSGCFGHVIKSFTITVLPLPQFNNPDNILLDLEKCDSDAIDDQSTIFDLTANENLLLGGQTGISTTYYTSYNDAAFKTNPIPDPASYANTSVTQTIYVRFENTLTGCFDILAFNIEIINPVVAGRPVDLALCDTEGDGQQWFNLSLNDIFIKAGNTSASVKYYATEQDALNETNPLPFVYRNHTPYLNQQIWARLENTTGCFGYDIVSFEISILPMPEIDFTAEIVDFTDYFNSINIVVHNDPDAYEYSIDGVNFSNSPYFGSLVPGMYTVYIRSKNGCRETQDEVVVLNYPKFFTPNGDGINENWTLPFLYLLPEAQVYIFDRYGKLLTGFPGNNQGWDGNYNGHPMPASDYWFVLELKGGRIIKGHFSMLR